LAPYRRLLPVCSSRRASLCRFEDAALCDGEDDGYLVSFVHDEDRDQSSLVVWDAKTMSSDPVAVVALPQRVPYGFHGLWVAEVELQKHIKAT